MANRRTHPDIEAGARDYQEWRAKLLADPEARRVYEEEAARAEIWLQLVEARMRAGLTQTQLAKRLGVSQAQVARVEKRGYDGYTLKTLRRYVDAIGNGLALEVRVVAEAPASLHRARPARRNRAS